MRELRTRSNRQWLARILLAALYLPIMNNQISENATFEMSEHHSSAQIALAWLMKQGNDIVPIPGTQHTKYLLENIQAVNVTLPESDWNIIEKFIAEFQFQGVRYPEVILKMVDRTE
ncbi:MAG: aldo/keto reductase [Gammaproteobacteria bacterium]|nr:aldo/keto reductase [Gammaproteobacteria bacterium]